jgi:ribose-phosphate pyrophosphokinase
MTSSSRYLLLGFPESKRQAQELAKLTGILYADIDIHVFPDGESKITLPAEALKSTTQIVIYRSLDHPNNKLLELIMAAQGARQLGIKKIILIAPYLAYMRQDIAFNPGEVVSQKVIGKLLSESFEGVITVDSHLHRISKLSEAIPVEYAINLTATEPMGEFLKHHVDRPFLLGPDGESRQWVEAIALPNKMDSSVATKVRRGDKNVEINLPDGDYQGRNIVLVDDVASSGQTLIQAAKQLQQYQPASISVLVTHALFMEGSIEALKEQGVINIWSCNSIKHPTNQVSLTGLLARELKEILHLTGENT